MLKTSSKEYKDFKEVFERFDKIDIEKEVLDIIRSQVKGDTQKEDLFRSNAVRGYLDYALKTIKVFGRNFLQNAHFVPKKHAITFIDSFKKTVQPLIDFSIESAVFKSIIENLEEIENSSFHINFTELNKAWIAIFPYLFDGYLKDFLEKDNSIVKVKKEISSLAVDVKKEANEAMKSVFDNVNKTLEEHQIGKHLANFDKMVSDSSRKRCWILVIMVVVFLIDIVIACYSICTTDSLFNTATSKHLVDSNLSQLYILKSTLPLFGLFSLCTFLLFILFRLYKSYLHISDSYNFKISLIQQMLVLSTSSGFVKAERELILSKIIDAVTHYHSTGFIDTQGGNKDEIQMLSSQLFSLLSKKD